MKIVKYIGLGLLSSILIIGLIKYNYQDKSELYGFDFETSPDEWKKYFLIRMFVPATPQGINKEIRDTRARLISDIYLELARETPDIQIIDNLKNKIIENDKRNDENTYFLETQGKKNYYKSVSAPQKQPLTVARDKLTVAPFWIYAGDNSRILRWVMHKSMKAKLTTTINDKNIEKASPLNCSGSGDALYCESVLNGLKTGEIQWSLDVNSPDKKIAHSGSLNVKPVSSFVFYADSQDSLKLHRKTIAFIKNLNEKKPIDIVIHGGDITSWGSNETEMAITANDASRINIPYIYVIGNHDFSDDYGYDYEAPYFRLLFAMGSRKDEFPYFKTFNFKTSNPEKSLKLIVWNTCFARTPARDFIQQDRMIKKELKSGNPAILAGHHSMTGKGWHSSFLGSRSEEWQRILYKDIFYNSKLLLYMNGHDHIYQRSRTPGKFVNTEHLMAGPASAQILFPYFKTESEVLSIQRKRTVTRIDIQDTDGNVKLIGTTYDVETGEAIDEFTIQEFQSANNI